MLPNTLIETFLSIAPADVKDKKEWATQARTEAREEIYDVAMPFTRKLLNHMYGTRDIFVQTPDDRINSWEVDLVFFDRLMGHAQFMESQAYNLGFIPTSNPPGLDVGAFLQEQIMGGKEKKRARREPFALSV